MATVKIDLLQIKRGSKAALERTLAGEKRLIDGEPAFEKDTGKLKVGNGVQDYKDLPYVASGSSSSNQIFFDIKSNFPVVGEANKLYVATDEKAIYLWDLKYVLITSTENYEYIDGGSAADWL